MIDCFGEQYNYEIVRYTDQKSALVNDVYGDKETFSQDDDNFNRFYPDDLENIISFIRMISKGSMNKNGNGPPVAANTKGTSFSSFASKQSSFGAKKINQNSNL